MAISSEINPISFADGKYRGLWTANFVRCEMGPVKFEIVVDEIIRGIDEPCVVTVTSGAITVTLEPPTKTVIQTAERSR